MLCSFVTSPLITILKKLFDNPKCFHVKKKLLSFFKFITFKPLLKFNKWNVTPFLGEFGRLLCITPLNLINYLNQGFDRGNSLYQKLWDHLGTRENLDLRLTKLNMALLLLQNSQALIKNHFSINIKTFPCIFISEYNQTYHTHTFLLLRLGLTLCYHFIVGTFFAFGILSSPLNESF